MSHETRVPVEPGGHMHWAWHLYDSADMVPVAGPGGRQIVAKHRFYQTPSGNPSLAPYVARVAGQYYHAWLPAVMGPRRPDGIRGKWVQLSKHHPGVALMHAPGIPTQLVRVLDVKQDGTGRPRAHVRWLRPEAQGRASNPAALVSTRGGPNVRRTRFVRVSQPIGVQAGGVLCRAFPWMKRCLPKKVCPAGTTPDQQGTCLPGSGIRRRAPVGNPPRVREMSVADDRARHGTALEGFRRTLRNLGTGRSRVILDRGGVKIQERRAA